MRVVVKSIFVIMLSSIVISCGGDAVMTPKPRMYPKVSYPDRLYTLFEESYCMMRFEYPAHTTIEKKEYFFDEKPNNECWFDISSEVLNYDLHCSYYEINKENTLAQLIDDSYKMTNKHNQKANYREELYIQNKQGVQGIQFEIDGPVASPIQFYVTDSTTHFFRASLYFNAKVNPDSIAPVLDYVKEDIRHIQETFDWK